MHEPGKAILDRQLQLLDPHDLVRVGPASAKGAAQLVIEPLVAFHQAENMI
jgi:hypothetical protein